MPLLDQIREEKLIDLAKACFDPPPQGRKRRFCATPPVPSTRICPLPIRLNRPSARSLCAGWPQTPRPPPISTPRASALSASPFRTSSTSRIAAFSCPYTSSIALSREKSTSVPQRPEAYSFLDSSFDEIIRADRINVDGPLFLRGSIFSGEIRLVGAKIKGALDCLGAKLIVKGENALSADRAEIGGIVYSTAGLRSQRHYAQIFESMRHNSPTGCEDQAAICLVQARSYE